MARDLPLTICGSLSLHPVSLGRAMHEAGYRALGLPFAYVPFGVEDLASAVRGMRALGIRGLGVSMPYKIAVLALLDRIDPLAARIGAANTIVNDSGILTGFNTDAWGATRALEEVTTLPGRRVVLLGAGGAARAVAHALHAEGATLRVLNRTPERAIALARELGPGVTGGGLDDHASILGAEILVNASSAGMSEYGAQSPVLEECIAAGSIVMDIVYKPIETELLRAATRRGARTIHGGRMLLHQAARQFELYTGHPAPLEDMDRALRARLAAPDGSGQVRATGSR